MKYEPALHRPIPMGTRVIVPGGYAAPESIRGRVSGISSVLCEVFIYIVILDTPLPTDYGDQEAIVVPGTMLEGENWKLET